jgi:hypothetical protein
MSDYRLLAEYLIREALQQAEHERLVRLAKMTPASQRWYASLLAALGAWLSARGSELEVRFGQTTPKPAIRLGAVPVRPARP